MNHQPSGGDEQEFTEEPVNSLVAFSFTFVFQCDAIAEM